MCTKAILTGTLLSVCAAFAFAEPVQFEDTSDKLGFERGTESWGISWGNINMDGWPDLYNHGHRDYTRLYRNTGNGDFEDVSFEYDMQMGGWWLSLPSRDVHMAALADFDRDGDDDVLVGDENEFFLNNAESGGYFTQLSISSEQAHAEWVPSATWTTLISETNCNGNYVQFIDLDVDGLLDRICGDTDNFPEEGSDQKAIDLVPALGQVADTAVGDFDNDLRTDIIATRGMLRPNGAGMVDANSVDIWFRAGTGTDVTFTTTGNVTFMIDGNRGTVFLRPDVFTHNSLSNFSQTVREIDFNFVASTRRWTVHDGGSSQHYIRVRAANPIGSLAVRNLSSADLPFQMRYGRNTPTGIAWQSAPGLGTAIQCAGIVAADFDNDMDLDLFLACGAGITNLPNRYYDNNGNGTFTFVPTHGGEGPLGAGLEFGVADNLASADYDVDGFMDLAIVNGLLYYPFGHGGPDTLIRNLGNSNHWIEIDLTGTVTNANGIGAKVYVTAGGVTQLREQNAGYHRFSQNDKRLHFGLAGNTAIQELRIEWPSGLVDTYANVTADRLYAAVEGTGLTAVALGPEVRMRVLPDEECGEPPYNETYGPAMMLWRDCGTSTWHLRFYNGLGRMTDDVVHPSVGRVSGDAAFGFANGTNLQASDSVGLAPPTRVNFNITVRPQAASSSKVLNFNVGGQQSTCLEFDTQSIEPLIIGSAGKRLDPPLDLSNGLLPCDTDGDGSNNSIDPDDDNDGVQDAADAFPLDPAEWADADGDGVGDNGDAFPTNPSEQHDGDDDGIGDHADVDADNDGIADLTELFDAGFSLTIPSTNIPADGGASTARVNLSTQGATIGQSVRVSKLLADGDLDGVPETFTLNFNNGQYVLANLQTGLQCAGTLFPTTTALNAVVPVINIGGGVPGISIRGSTQPDVDIITQCGNFGARYRLTISAISAYDLDEDRDLTLNAYDLDSDNDTIADVVEAGLTDADDDFIVDDLSGGQGSVTDPPDSDSDGIPDFLDRESGNAQNNGTAYDIAGTSNAARDGNGDGQLGVGDAGAGIDADGDGIDDLIDRDPGKPGSAEPGGNGAPTANGQFVVTNVNTPRSIRLTGSDPDLDVLDFLLAQMPMHGTLSGTAPNLTYTPDSDYTGPDTFTFRVDDGQARSAPALVVIDVQELERPLTDWAMVSGGVEVLGNIVSYAAPPGGWNNNTARSVAFSTLGYDIDYVVRFTITESVANGQFVVGLGVAENSNDWRDVDYAFRSTNGQLSIRENGTFVTTAPVAAIGDVLALHVGPGSIEYRVNDHLLHTSTYTGMPAFYVDSSFNSGSAGFAVSLLGIADPTNPGTVPVTGWTGATAGVSVSGSGISYSGSPTGWNSTVNSPHLSSFGAADAYEISFQVTSPPAGAVWVVGLSASESGPDWRDVEFGLRNDGGALRIYENGTWRAAAGALAIGDKLAIAVDGTTLEYRRNDVGIYSTTIGAASDFYIDSSFKNGAADLGSFTLKLP